MREIIFMYARNIAFYIIFMNVILILVPNVKYRGYIKTVLGFVLIIIILKPIDKLFEMRENISLDKLIDEYSINITKKEYNEANAKQRELIEKQFEEDMLIQIRELLKAMEGVKVNRVKAEYIKEKEEIAGISSLNVYIEGEGDLMKIKNIISDFYKLDYENINVIEEGTKDKEMMK